MLWRSGIILTLMVGAGVLAYQIGARLSDEAIMTLAGVSCGILASIPVSIGLLIALTRERSMYPANDYVEPEPEPEPYQVYRPAPPRAAPALASPHIAPPQIIVVAPPQNQLPQNFLPYGNYPAPPSMSALSAPMQERTFKIIGAEDDE